MSDFQIQPPPLPLPAFNLLLRGLSLLPLGESRQLYDFLQAEAERQVAQQREQQVTAAMQARAPVSKPRKAKPAQGTAGS